MIEAHANAVEKGEEIWRGTDPVKLSLGKNTIWLN